MTIDSQQITQSEELLEWDLTRIRWDNNGLIPVVVQDVESKAVIMLAYMNEDALRLTIKEKRAWYYSRSRQQLWRKGETSGHTQEVVDLFFDCDLDALLLKVNQTGMACHENYFTCFHNKGSAGGFKPIGKINERPINIGVILEQLTDVIRSRKIERPEGAYTTYLFDKGIDKILKKVGEESAEVIIAAKNNSSEEICYEVSDLIYHLLVMLEEREVDLTDIALELSKRRK